MGSLKEETSVALRKQPFDYFCFAISEEHPLDELKEALSLFQGQETQFLDITFSKAVQKNADYLNRALRVLLPALNGTKITRLDLSCNSLQQIGFVAVQELFALMPENISTVVLSGNHWGKLGLEAVKFLEQLQEKTTKELLFEGTDNFERLVTQLQQGENPLVQVSSLDRNRLFSNKEPALGAEQSVAQTTDTPTAGAAP